MEINKWDSKAKNYRLINAEPLNGWSEVEDGEGFRGMFCRGKMIVPVRYRGVRYDKNYAVGYGVGEIDIYNHDGNLILHAPNAKTVINTGTFMKLTYEEGYRFYDYSGNLIGITNNVENMNYEMAICVNNPIYDMDTYFYDKSGKKIVYGECEAILVYNDFVAAKKDGVWEILCQR